MADESPNTVFDSEGVEPTPSNESSPRTSKKMLWIIASCVLVVALALGGYLLFGRKESPKAPPPYTGPAEKLRIGNVGEYSVLNLIAQQQGLFTKNGIDATITEYSSGAPSITDLLAGKEDVAIAGDFVGVTNIFNSSDLRILSQVSDQQVFQVVARKDKGITKPANLKGKKIGVTRKSSGEFFLGRFATQNELLLTDLTIVNLSPADMVAQLKSGQLDAVVTFEPHVYNLKKDLGDQLMIWSAQGDEATIGLSFSTRQFIQDHPDLIKRYLTSLSQAQDLLQSQPQTAKDILAQSLSYEPAYVDYLWTKIHFGLSLPQELLLTLEDQARFSIENKLTTQTIVPNYLDYIYFKALEQVKPEVITIVH